MDQEKVEEMFRRFERANPDPRSELNFRNPFELLIAVMLSAQATDASVNKCSPALFKLAPDARTMAKLDPEEVAQTIKSIGLYRSKAKHVVQCSQILVERFGGEVPQTREELESLPGVGRKTANVTLNVVFGKDAFAVDTHIFRVSRRIGLSQGKTPLEVELDDTAAIPKPFLGRAHHWLILHGRYVCKARKPDCASCLINDLCEWPKKTAGASAIAPDAHAKRDAGSGGPDGASRHAPETKPKRAQTRSANPSAARRPAAPTRTRGKTHAASRQNAAGANRAQTGLATTANVATDPRSQPKTQPKPKPEPKLKSEPKKPST